MKPFRLVLIRGMDAMSFENLMNAYAARQQMGSLEYENNKCILMVDDQIEVSCFQANGRFYAYSIITKLPGDKGQREELLMRLLEKNLALVATERVSLCIDPDENALALYISSPINSLNIGDIEDAIVALANNHKIFVKWAGQSAPPVGPGMMFMP